MADPTWNYIVLAVAAVFQGLGWRVSQQEINRHRRAGESLWHAIQRLERAIKLPYPSIQHLYLESGALKPAARSP